METRLKWTAFSDVSISVIGFSCNYRFSIYFQIGALLIEGDLKPGSKVVVIEDLISTGGSSLKAVEAIRNAGCDVIGMIAIFTYGFPVSEEKFKESKVKLTALCNYDAILDEALRTDYIDEAEIKTLQEWRKDPAHWNPK